MAKKLTLEERTDRALARMNSSKSVDAYNELCRAVSLEAFAQMLEKARNGEYKCILELFKNFQIKPKIENYVELSKVDNLSCDDMSIRLKQLEMRLKNKNFDKLTVTIVNQAWLDDEITKTECDLLMSMIKDQTYATRERELQNDIVINLSEEVESVLQDDVKTDK